MVTKKDIRQLLKKGLTGWQAGLLVFEDSWLVDHGGEGFLGPEDISAIKAGLRTPRDTEDYNTLIRLYRVVDYIERQAFTFTAVAGLLLERVAGIGFIYYAHYMARWAMRELPLIVTEKQLVSLKRSQKSFKLKQLHCLDQVISLRAYEMASEEQKAEEEHLEEDIEQWAPDLYQQAQGEIQGLIEAGKLTPVRLPMPANEVGKFQPGQWRTDIEEWPVTASPEWSEEKASEMLQTGFSGRELYKARLPEWVREVEKFDLWLTDEDLWPTEEPPYSFAIIQEPAKHQVDKRGFYKPTYLSVWPMRPIGAGQDDPDFAKTLAAGVAPRAMEMVEATLVRRQVLEEVSRIVGIDVAGNVTEIMELFLEPSLGRYNLFSSYHKSTMEALESLESGKDKRDLPEEYLTHLTPGDRMLGEFPALPPINPAKIKPPAAKVREIRGWISEVLGDNWWKTGPRASEPEEEASDAS